MCAKREPRGPVAGLSVSDARLNALASTVGGVPGCSDSIRSVGHTDDSVFAPVTTDVTHHDYEFTDDEHIKVRDHVVAYATTVPFGVDSEGPIDHAQVKKVMVTAGLGVTAKDLAGDFRVEGGFDTVNTYDRAKVTWG